MQERKHTKIHTCNKSSKEHMHTLYICIEHALDAARCMQLLHGILHCSHVCMSGMRACQACMSSLELERIEPEMLLHRSGGPL